MNFHMQAHSLDFTNLHGSDFKEISVLLHLLAIISQDVWEDPECSEKSEAEELGKSTVSSLKISNFSLGNSDAQLCRYCIFSLSYRIFA